MTKNGGSFMQNTRYGGHSIDTFVGDPGTFDKSEGIDIHNALNGITLAPKGSKLTNKNKVECYLTYDKDKLYRLTLEENNSNDDVIRIYCSDNVVHEFGDIEHDIVMDGSISSSVNPNFPTRPRNAVRLRNDIFILCEHRVYKYDPVAGTHEVQNPVDRRDSSKGTADVAPIIPAIEYHESLIIAGYQNRLYTYSPITNERKKVREFQRGIISGIFLLNESIAVVSNEGHDSIIYVLGGNFDAEDIGVLQYIPLPGLSVTNVGQQGGRLMVLCTDLIDGGHTKFYEIRGSTPILLKQTRNGNEFYYNKTLAGIFVLDQVIPSIGNRFMITTSDGIRVYGSPNANIPEASYLLATYNGLPQSNHAHGQYFFLSHGGDEETRYYMGQDPNKKVYQETGSLVTRQFFGRELRSIKSMIFMFISFFLSPNGSIELYIRKNLSTIELIGVIDKDDDDDLTRNNMRQLFENVTDQVGDWNTCSIEIVLKRGSNVNLTPIVYEVGAIYEHHSL